MYFTQQKYIGKKFLYVINIILLFFGAFYSGNSTAAEKYQYGSNAACGFFQYVSENILPPQYEKNNTISKKYKFFKSYYSNLYTDKTELYREFLYTANGVQAKLVILSDNTGGITKIVINPTALPSQLNSVEGIRSAFGIVGEFSNTIKLKCRFITLTIFLEKGSPEKFILASRKLNVD